MQKQMPTSKDENKARMANGLQTRVIDIERRKKAQRNGYITFTYALLEGNK